MKKLFVAAMLLFVGMVASAQNAAISASIADSDGQTWNNGSYQISFVPPSGYTGTAYTFNGASWTPPTPINGVLNGLGNFNYSPLPRNDYILPTGSGWQFLFCPVAASPCSSTTIVINQASQTITSSLVIVAPRFPASNTYLGSFGYNDQEVLPIDPPIGNFYWNVTLLRQRYWTGTEWVDYNFTSPLIIQHNGSNLPNQDLLNFLDTPADLNPPGLDANFQPVVFKNDSHGALAAETASIAQQYTMLVQAPIDGQYVIVPATVASSSVSGFPIVIGGANAIGGYIYNDTIGLTGSGSGTITLTDPILPSYILPANVTAVYGFALASSNALVPPTGDTCDSGPYLRNGDFTTNDQVTGTGIGTFSVVSGNQNGYALAQYTSSALGITGANFSSLTTTISYSTSGHCVGTAYMNVPLAGYIVYYTGSAPPVSSNINVVPPLQFAAYSNQLSIDQNAEFTATSIVPTIITALPIASSVPGQLFLVSDGTGPSDCTTGGASTFVLCKSNGTTYLAYGNGAGVNSWSGDGVLFNNSNSTGAVTSALAQTTSYKIWGNCTNSTATPTYCALLDAMLPTQGGFTPGNYTNVNLTVNAQGIITAISNGSGGGGNFSPVVAQNISGFGASITLPNNIAQGSAVVTEWFHTNGSISTPTDAQGDNFVLTNSQSIGGAFDFRQYTACNVAGGSTTVTMPGSSGWNLLYAYEIQNAAAACVDGANSNPSDSASSLSTGSISTIAPNDLIFVSGAMRDGASSGSLSEANGYTNLQQSGNQANLLYASWYGIDPTFGSISDTVTNSIAASPMYAGILAIRPPALGGNPSVTFNVATGIVASPATPYILAPVAGWMSHCYFTTLTSDSSTNLVFNVKKNGTSILSGSSATVTASTSPGTVSTFSLTSSTISIVQSDKWEIDITTGTSNWSGAAQCY